MTDKTRMENFEQILEFLTTVDHSNVSRTSLCVAEEAVSGEVITATSAAVPAPGVLIAGAQVTGETSSRGTSNKGDK